jgi:hypothetical protein
MTRISKAFVLGLSAVALTAGFSPRVLPQLVGSAYADDSADKSDRGDRRDSVDRGDSKNDSGRDRGSNSADRSSPDGKRDHTGKDHGRNR